MGGHPNDYLLLGPPQSYIHVDQFQSPMYLARYLQYLDENDVAYNKYFEWKHEFDGGGGFFNLQFKCRLCAMVEVSPQCPVWYDDINTWWYNDNQTCISHGKTWT